MDYLDKYHVLLDSRKNSKKFYTFKKMQMKIGATQTEPYLALCLIQIDDGNDDESALDHLPSFTVANLTYHWWREICCASFLLFRHLNFVLLGG